MGDERIRRFMGVVKMPFIRQPHGQLVALSPSFIALFLFFFFFFRVTGVIGIWFIVQMKMIENDKLVSN